MKLNLAATKTLQALRAGEMTSAELGERFGTGYEIASLLRNGLIVQTQFGYKITDLGRENCPTRVKNLPPAARSVTKKQPAALIAMPALPPIRPSTLNIKSETIMNHKKTDTPTALLMLQCIGAYPNLTMPEIAKLIGKDCGPNYIPSYIERGHVLIEVNDKNQKTYSLLDGMTAQEVYDYKKMQKDKALQAAVPAGGMSDLANRLSDKSVATAPVPELTPKEMVPELDDYVVNVHSHAEMLSAVNKMCAEATIEILGDEAKQILNPKVNLQTEPVKPTVKYAFTSDSTFIIYGVADKYIELTQEQTEALFDFVESASLMMPANVGFSLGGATL